MKVLKVLRARPELFFRLSGVRLADFETLVARLYPVWLLREEKRLSRKGRQRAIGGGRKYQLAFAEQMLLCLIYYGRTPVRPSWVCSSAHPALRFAVARVP